MALTGVQWPCLAGTRCHLPREGNTIPGAKSGKCLRAAWISQPHLSLGTLLWLSQVLCPFRWRWGPAGAVALSPAWLRGSARCPSSTSQRLLSSHPRVTAGCHRRAEGQLRLVCSPGGAEGGLGQLWGSVPSRDVGFLLK